MAFTWWRYPTRRFDVHGRRIEITTLARTDGLLSRLRVDGRDVASDRTPLTGVEAVRNHSLEACLPDGRLLEIEVGYVSLWTTGVRATSQGSVVHESHPGRTIAYPEKYRETTVEAGKGGMKDAWRQGLAQSGTDWSVWRRNKVPLGIDIALGLLFFILAKLTDLTTAALAGAAIGLALVVAQRFVSVDLLGGLALFGIVMLLVSAGLALAFQDEDAIKLRTTVVGVVAAVLMIGDGVMGGRRLGAGLARYIPYGDLDVRRLAIGMGVLGLAMAGLNLLVARLLSTDAWLLYTTFGDFLVVVVLVQPVFAWARGRIGAAGHQSPPVRDEPA